MSPKKAHKTERSDSFPAFPGCISEEINQSITMGLFPIMHGLLLYCVGYLLKALIQLTRNMEDSAIIADLTAYFEFIFTVQSIL